VCTDLIVYGVMFYREKFFVSLQNFIFLMRFNIKI